MPQMKIKKMIVGPVQTNCYLVYEETSRQAVLIDPADDAERILREMNERALTPCAILLTHGHFDHIQAVDALKKKYDIPVYIHEEDMDMAPDPVKNASAGFGMNGVAHPDAVVRDGDVLKLAGFTISVIYTPGHTKGGVCYYFEEEQVLFSGDTLFAQSIGRTDLPTGSYSQLIRSIKEKLLVLPDEVHVFPGHMEETTIAYEKQYNPYVSG